MSGSSLAKTFPNESILLENETYVCEYKSPSGTAIFVFAYNLWSRSTNRWVRLCSRVVKESAAFPLLVLAMMAFSSSVASARRLA